MMIGGVWCGVVDRTSHGRRWVCCYQVLDGLC